jgi:ferredoxin
LDTDTYYKEARIVKAFVNEEKCIGCTLCTAVCPEVFKMNGDKAVAYADPVPKGSLESCRDAAEQCPTEAIKISE